MLNPVKRLREAFLSRVFIAIESGMLAAALPFLLHDSSHGAHAGGDHAAHGEHGPKKSKNLDELMSQLREQHSSDLDKAFEAYEGWNKKEHQNHIYNHLLTPAQEELYKGIKDKVEEVFHEDEAKIHNKEKEIKQVVTHGIKKYFEKAKPSVGKILEDMQMSEDEQYDFLTQFYDAHVGAEGQRGGNKEIKSIRNLAEFAKDRKALAGDLVRFMAQNQGAHKEGALNALNSKHFQHHFLKFDSTELAAYLKPKFEEHGYEIDRKPEYLQADHGELLGLHQRVIEKKGHPYLRKKGDAEEEAHGGDHGGGHH